MHQGHRQARSLTRRDLRPMNHHLLQRIYERPSQRSLPPLGTESKSPNRVGNSGRCNRIDHGAESEDNTGAGEHHSCQELLRSERLGHDRDVGRFHRSSTWPNRAESAVRLLMAQIMMLNSAKSGFTAFSQEDHLPTTSQGRRDLSESKRHLWRSYAT